MPWENRSTLRDFTRIRFAPSGIIAFESFPESIQKKIYVALKKLDAILNASGSAKPHHLDKYRIDKETFTYKVDVSIRIVFEQNPKFTFTVVDIFQKVQR